MVYEIRKYGDPVLREKASPIEDINDEIRQLAEDMLRTMYQARGLGLAAQQIGETRSIFVLDVPAEMDADEEGQRLHPELSMPMVMINAEITERSEDTGASEEGCLSFPEINAPINRPLEIDVTYQDQTGKQHTLHAGGLLGRAIQHELDHVNGILFIDKMTSIKKMSLSGRLKRLRKETEKRLTPAG